MFQPYAFGAFCSAKGIFERLDPSVVTKDPFEFLRKRRLVIGGQRLYAGRSVQALDQDTSGIAHVRDVSLGLVEAANEAGRPTELDVERQVVQHAVGLLESLL